MTTGLVFNIQKYSVQDGPGIRSTVFLKGCPLCCQWCHNPESQAAQPEVMIIESRCIHCGLCRAACPPAAPFPNAEPLPIKVEGCDLCGDCVAACPTEARQIIGRRMTVDEVMAEVVRDRVFYEDSGGGVTFSGGEPLTQPAFLLACLEACRSRGLRAAVDTCGFACTETLLGVAKLANLILFDLKLMDDRKHREYTGVSNVPILENLRALAGIHSNIWIRVPLIPGINDDAANLEAVAELVSSLTGVRQVSLLPYHRIGAQKFRRLGLRFPLQGVEPPSAEQVNGAVARFRAHGLVVKAAA